MSDLGVSSRHRPSLLLWVIAVAALFVALLTLLRPIAGSGEGAGRSVGLVENIDRTGKLRVGYGVFPPFTQEDPTTHQVSGVSVDIMNEIGRQLGVEVEWHRFNWNTMKADLQRGEFDVLADAIFQTPARGREMTFTEPYAYFAIGIGVVRRSEDRFTLFGDINNPSVRVAVGQGFAEETFVRARAPRANINSVPSATDTAAPINAVVTGRADIAIVNLEDAKRFVSANSRDLKMLWDQDPPAYVPAGFVVRFGDLTGAQFLDVSLRNLRATGVLHDVAAKHGVLGNFRVPPT
jgi:ABC-type amino acid transport substrate-binding protein